MHEIDLGTVDASAGQLNALLDDADPRLRQGRFHIVGRRDERGAVRSGALVRHVGNDQWSVYLLNEQQLEKVAQRQLRELGRESGGMGSEVATEAGITIAAHALGPVGMALAPLAEITSIAGSALGLGGESSATKIARKLAAGGVAPSDVNRVVQEVRATTGDPTGSASSATQERTSDDDVERRAGGAAARTAATIDRPMLEPTSRETASARREVVGLAGEVAQRSTSAFDDAARGKRDAHEVDGLEPSSATSHRYESDAVEERIVPGPSIRDDRYDMPHVDPRGGDASHAAPARPERYDIPVPKPRTPARSVDTLGLER